MTQEIAIDARAHLSGLGVYARNLVRELHDSFGWSIHALAHRDRVRFLAPYCARTTVVDSPIYSVEEQLAVARSVRHDRVLHVPHYNFPLLYRGELLLTIHDLTHLIYPGYASRWKSRLGARALLQAGVRRAGHIFTVSEYSKGNIVDWLGAKPDRVTVVYNGVGAEFHPGNRTGAREEVAERFSVQTPYILYVGNLKPHKNVGALLRAFAELPRKREYALLLVGKDQSGLEPLLGLAAELGIAPRLVADATDAEVAQLYRAAEVLVLPSFEEGFGLPVVEAMACGTPVVCSKTGSLPEIAGDAALYFDPHDIHHLAGTLEMVLDAPALRDALCARGLARAARFTWRETAERHVDVYRRFCA